MLFLALSLALALTEFQTAFAYLRDIGRGPMRDLSDYECRICSMDESELVLLGRLLSIEDAVPAPGASELDMRRPMGPGVRRILRVEPIEFIKGGIDGDEIEVLDVRYPAEMREYVSYKTGQDHWPEVERSAGVDTLGVILFLKNYRSEWMPLQRCRNDGYAVVAQRRWKATVDGLRKDLAATSLDSLVAKSDMVAIVARAGSDSLVRAMTIRTMRGTPPAAALLIRTPDGIPPKGLALLRLVGEGLWECVPFHRLGLEINEENLRQLEDAIQRSDAASPR